MCMSLNNPKINCVLYNKGVCPECHAFLHFGCPELKKAFEAGRKEGLARFANLSVCKFQDSWGRTMYAFWNKNNATEDELRQNLLLYPNYVDRRFLYVDKLTLDFVFGELVFETDDTENVTDPYSRVKVANTILYYGVQSTIPERGTIVDVIRPSEKCPKGKIWVALKDRIIRAPFSAIGKILFFSEQDVYEHRG